MAGVYSTRFALQALNVPAVYTVPNGKRAIVKMISAYNAESVASGFSMSVAGIYVWFASLPGGQPALQPNLFIVVRSGEQMKWLSDRGNTYIHASGYLLDET